MADNVLELASRPHEDNQFVALFLRGRPETTAKAYNSEIRMFSEFVNKPLRLVEADDLRAYVESGRKARLAPGTIRNRVAVLKSLFAFLHQEGHLTGDPLSRISTPPHPLPDGTKTLDSKQVREFFSAISERLVGRRDRAMFLIAANCGLRLSELSRLSCGDVSEAPESGWKLLSVKGKGDRLRAVQVRPEVWHSVQEYLRRRHDELVSSAPLFASMKRGNSIRPQAASLRIPAATIYKRFKFYSVRAGLPPWASPHALRHWFASEAHEKGAPAEAIRRALGHQSLAHTARYLDRLDKGLNAAFLAVKTV